MADAEMSVVNFMLIWFFNGLFDERQRISQFGEIES